MIKSSVKFHEYIPYGLGVMSRTRSKHLHYMSFWQGEGGGGGGGGGC